MSDTAHLEGFVVAADGLKFPAAQVASADVNTLDDYEEGTFTPTIRFGGGSTGVAYVAQSGGYTKIGRLVSFQLNVGLSSKGSSTGVIDITGLPFPIASVHAALAIYAEGLSGISGALMALAAPGGSAIAFYYLGTGTPSQLLNTNATNSSAFIISGCYAV